MNLQKIYESLKKEYESKGLEIDDSKLRQLAWIKRDRMMFESSLSVSQSPSAGAGGGGRIISSDIDSDYIDPDYIDPDYFM
jgi:hypothetical protein